MRYFFVFLTLCLWHNVSAQQGSLIPKPVSMQPGQGYFELSTETKIVLKGNSSQLKPTVDLFLDIIERSTGVRIPYDNRASSAIEIELSTTIANPEGYTLNVQPDKIDIKAQTAAGVFYALQTLRQLFPPEIESPVKIERVWTIPAVSIVDAPRFGYRGLLLDVARHFFPVSYLKRYIDLMVLYKYNRLHLHLTDDQGWRIEIKQYPKLQEISAWRSETLVGLLEDTPWKYDGIRHGGYYTQEELKDLVKYAAARHVTIVPEFDMPGHATAVLAAYPDLACSGGPFTVAREWGIFKDVYCPKEATFTFIENVLSEIMQIFPGEYIHIGGDECPKDRWKESEYCQNLKIQNGLKTDEQLQTYFIKRVARYVNSQGRKIIGWDEILDGGDVPGATIMSWRGEEGGIVAVQKGHNAIMTPHKYCYFDYYQWRYKDEAPLITGSFLPLSKVYMYNPVPKELTEQQATHILGSQGNLWTEYISDEQHIEYMVYPRACALSESVWTPLNLKSYDDFLTRLREHSKRLDILQVNYAKHFLGK